MRDVTVVLKYEIPAIQNICCGKIIVNNILKFKGVVSLFIFSDNHTCAKCKQLEFLHQLYLATTTLN